MSVRRAALTLAALACVLFAAPFHGAASAAPGEPAVLTKLQSDALKAYNEALNAFKAVLRERRAQIDAKEPLPDLPGQALYLARVDVMSTYKDLTDAIPSRIGRPNKFGVPPAYFDADIEPLIEEYRESFRHHGGAAGECAELKYADKRRRRSLARDRAGQRPRCGERRRGGPHRPRRLLCRDEWPSKHRQCALEQIHRQPANGCLRGSQRPEEMGGDQEGDRSDRSCAWRARRQGRSARSASWIIDSIIGPPCATA